MRIPYDDRIDKYSVEWETVDGNGKSFQYATITIHELWGIGHLTFKDPLVIEVFLGDSTKEDVLAVFDFGMDYRISITKEKNYLYNYVGENEKVEPIKTVFSTVKFDLMHAFFHYSGDPNYGHTHWALYGNLKDKAEADDDFIWEDYEYDKALKDKEDGHLKTE